MPAPEYKFLHKFYHEILIALHSGMPILGQVSAWQSATLPLMSVPARVEELFGLRQSSSRGARNNPPFRKMPRVGSSQNWHSTSSVYSAEGGDLNQQHFF